MTNKSLISFDDIDAAIAQDDEAKVTKSVALATRVDNPDVYAEHLRLAEQTGLPMDTVERNKQKVVQQQKLTNTDIQAIFNDAPEARKWLSDKDNAALVSDDFSTVGQLKKAFGDVPKSLSIGLDEQELVDARFSQLFGAVLTPEQDSRLQAISTSRKMKTGTGGWFSDALNMTARNAPQIVEQGKSSIGGALAGGGVAAAGGAGAAFIAGQLGPQIATPEEIVTVPASALAWGARGARAGWQVGGYYESFRQNAAFAYDQLLGIKNEAGEALEPEIARGAAIATGVISGGLDKLGFEKMLDNFPGVAAFKKAIAREGIEKVLAKGGMKEAFKRIGQRFATGMTAEAITEGVQEIVSILGEEIAKAGSENEFDVVDGGEAVQRVGEAVRGGALVGGTVSGIGATASVPFELRRKNYTPEQAAAHVDAVNEAVKTSKLYQRNPARFYSLATDLAGDERFYINGKAALEMVGGLSPADQEKLLSTLPELRDELELAASSDADVSIKKADYAAYFASLPSAEKLRDYIKLDPEGESIAERNERITYIEKNPDVAARIMQAVDAAPKEDAGGVAAVERIVRKAMQDAGRSVAEARSVALLFARSMARFAAPFGERATDMLNRMELRFQQVGADGKPFSQGSNIGVMLRDLAIMEAGGEVTGLDDAGKEALAAFGKRLDEAGITTQEAIKMGADKVGARLNPAGQGKTLEQGGKTLEEMQGDWVDRFGAETAIYETGDNAINLGKLVIDKPNRSKGGGTAIMQELVDYADANGKRIDLSPSRDFGGSSVGRLKEFYRRFGFVENKGKNKDFAISESMYRPAQTRKLNQRDDITQTPAFKAWFGDSKVVDAEGKPLVVYHGTIHDPKAFADEKTGWVGHYFSKYAPEANNYARSQRDPSVKNPTPQVMPVYLSIQNPANSEQYRAALDKSGGGNPRRQAKDILIAQGFDGVMLDAPSGQIIAFYPEQIKSVNNQGAFNPNDANILNQAERGSIEIDKALRRVVVSFTSRANMSTAAHEFSHFGVAMHRNFAAMAREQIAAGDANPELQRIVDDWEALKKAVGATSDEFTVEQEEVAARQFEAYLREGKAPSEALRPVFSRFRDWLMAIYKDIRALGEPLNPEVAGVFDRWLASDEEISAVREKNDSLNDIASALGLDGDIAAKVAEYVESAKNYAEEKLFRQLSREQRRLQSEGYRNEFAKTREGVVQEFNQQPVFAALNFLRDTNLRIYVGERDLVHEDFVYAPDDAETATLADYEAMLQAETDANSKREHAVKVLLAPRPKQPLTLFKAIRANGGLNEKALAGDLKALGVRGRLAQSLNRKKGKTLDYMREALAEDGWLPADSDINMLLEMIGEEAAGKPVTHPADAELVMQWEAVAEAERYASEMGIDLEAERFSRRGLGNYGWAFTMDRTDPQAASADEVAEMHGYESGRELLRAMKTAPQFDRAVDEETRKRLAQQFPNMIEDKRIKNEAVKAILNDRTILALDLMIKGLGGGNGVNMRQFARVIAQQRIGKMKMADVGYAFRHEVAREKSIREALKAARSGKPEQAVIHLQNALVSQSIFKGLEKVADAKQKAEILFKRVNQKDKELASVADMDFIGAARHLLSRFGLGAASFDFTQWEADLREKHPEIVADIQAFMDAVKAEPKKAKDLTTQEYLDIYHAVQNLFHAGRKMQEFKLGEERVAMKEAVGDLVEQFGSIASAPRVSGTQVYGKARFHQNLMALKALQRRVEHWVERIDSGFGGPARRYIWQPISDAAVEYREARAQWMEKLHAILKEHEKQLTQRSKIPTGMFKADGTELVLRDKQELIGFLLHTGNESNLDKLLGGYGIDPDNFVKAVAKMQVEGVLTKKDYQLVQKLWDLAEGLKPLSQEAHRELYGYRFDEIEPAVVVTEFGAFRGGYWPAIVDREQVDMLHPEEPTFILPTTSKGFTKSRVRNFRAPLSTNLKLASSHIDQVLRFAYLEAPVRNANRLTNDADFKAALKAIDPAALTDMIRPWLDRAARQITAEPVNLRGDSLMGTGARYLRRSASMQTMMGNLANAVQNYTGLSVAMYKVGARNFAKAFTHYALNPSQTTETIRGLSQFMRVRQNTLDNDISNEISEIVLRQGYFSKIRHAAVKHGYIFQRITQTQVDNVTWLAAYGQAIGDGMPESEAVKYADSAVRLTQSSGAPEDISKIEAGSEIGKPFLMFYSYFNNIGNLVGTEASKILSESGWSGSPRLFYLYLMTVSIPAVIGDLIGRAMRDDLPDDDDEDGEVLDDWLAYISGTQARFTAAAVPYLGQAINAALNTMNDRPFDDRITTSPVIGQGETTIRFVTKELSGGYEDKSQEVRDGLNALGFVTGLPLGQLGKPLGYLADVAEGDAQPQGVGDYARGLAGGPAPSR